MPRITRRAEVPYTREQMYQLVNDVRGDPSFFPFCRDVEVLEESSTTLVARIRFAKGPISIKLTTRNTMQAPELIDIGLVEGPFRRFSGHWRFEHGPNNHGSVAIFDLDFEVSATGLVGMALAKLFDEIAASLVDAYCRRAEVVYGVA